MTVRIAADWGTSRLRIWALDAGGEVTGSTASDAGMRHLTPDAFEPAFLRAAVGLLPELGPVEILICGMAGARTGWQEVSYAAVPCVPIARPERIKTIDPRLHVSIIPGLSQSTPSDVMRGEETQIAGFLKANPGFDGVICLPGTHTKWVRVAEGRLQSFRTAMTGELFDLLGTRSTLAGLLDDGWNEAAFDEAVNRAVRSQSALAADLFSLRAAGLLEKVAPGAARAGLSAVLIGQEVASMRPIWQDQPVALIGDATLADLYHRALKAVGHDAERFEAGELTLVGLCAAFETLREDAQ
ncbi:2-keto-3-deoxy-galactonokinase [Sulfitobacter sp. BDSS02]|nr:2-keto-3-deoxy-galactonokinase [Sulfitobacter sp. BDSS02]MBR9848174.1 2-dehydro-3-deoxygalactonokinase [Paracoccaceae bacterium]